MDLVEKVARAIVADDFVQVQGGPATQATIDEAWRDDISAATAAINAVLDAIAEPSDTVLFAGYLADGPAMGESFEAFMRLAPGWRSDQTVIYRAMIAALRKEIEE